MIIKSLELSNFRNYTYEKADFSNGLNLITGPNGQGKTNLIEAIYLLSMGKSFRTNKDKEMILFGNDHFIIRAMIRSSGREYKIEIKVGKEIKKAVNINSLPIEKITDLLGIFNVVIFAPEDLKLVKEGPGERRSFMDREISQIRPLYYNHIFSYRKALLQRNNLLKNKWIDENLLSVYEEQMSILSWHIMNIRKEFVEKIAVIAQKNHGKISSEKECLSVDYEPNIGNGKEIPGIEEIRLFFEKNRAEDIKRHTTTGGPHRDDIGIRINGRDLRSYGSQGQKRSAAISMKLSEIELIYDEKGEYPVILLDDIFSELDTKRQKMLMENLKEIQTFVTTTHIDKENPAFFEDVRIYHIENAQIK